MKSKIYRIIVAVAVMAVMLLQVAWMAHTFMLYSTGGSDDVADSFVAFFYDNWLLIIPLYWPIILVYNLNITYELGVIFN